MKKIAADRNYRMFKKMANPHVRGGEIFSGIKTAIEAHLNSTGEFAEVQIRRINGHFDHICVIPEANPDGKYKFEIKYAHYFTKDANGDWKV
mgnify:CR=1 FL=1